MRQLAHTARELDALQRHYQQIAPPSLLRASRVYWLDQQILTLAANNTAVAAKLRQLAPQLALQLRQRGAEVTGIKVTVQVTMPPAKPDTKGHTLSTAGRRQVGDLAQNLPDSPLKNALQRLARLGQQD